MIVNMTVPRLNNDILFDYFSTAYDSFISDLKTTCKELKLKQPCLVLIKTVVGLHIFTWRVWGEGKFWFNCRFPFVYDAV